MPITARLVAKLIDNAGADRVLTVDLHAGQIQGFFDIPVDEMTAMSLLARYFMRKRLPNPVVVSPDLGNTKRARNFAEFLDAPAGDHREAPHGQRRTQTEVLNLIGSVDGCQAVLVDDEIDTAGSITQAAQVCLDNGATEVYATCTHAVLSGPAIERLRDARIKEVVVTDTIAHPPGVLDKLVTISIAPILAETIQRIHTGTSVSAAFRSPDLLPA